MLPDGILIIGHATGKLCAVAARSVHQFRHRLERRPLSAFCPTAPDARDF